MFTEETKQSARHKDGYLIYIADKEHAGYEDSHIQALVESEFMAGIVPLYATTLQITEQNHETRLTPNEILQRISKGLSFLGIANAVVYD